ncbi:MAG: NAD-dependent DNA ligase LigA [Leadbetterella sp.]
MKERIDFLTDKLNYYTTRYYTDAVSEISDEEFDLLLKELESLENQHPQYKRLESPTSRVGGEINKSFETVKHRYPMLSLSNTYSEQELRDWDERVQKGLNGAAYEYICEIKFDGISLSLTYENGVLTRAVTRGDGSQGDNITANVRTIKSLPLRVVDHSKPDLFSSVNPLYAMDSYEIRGEGYMPNAVFEKLNQEREKNGEALLANPRNSAAGTFKMQDSTVVAQRGLDCYIYQFLSENDAFKTHEESLLALKKAGFNVSNSWKKANNIDQVIEYIHHWSQKRHDLPCATDGIVIKLNNYAQREDLGFTAKSPRWAIAYKYKAESKSTQLLGVSYQVGRTGAVTPVAELYPIELSGTTVRRATLHNTDEIQRLGLCVNDYVFVEKAGEIIPKITGVDTQKSHTNDRIPVDFPTHCPECNTLLVRNEGEAAYFCTNEVACPPQIKGRIEHFIQRKAMNIDSLGEGKIEILLENGIIKDASDLYYMSYEQLLGLEKVHIDENTGKERKVSFKEKTVQNILEGIELSKQQGFDKVLFGLGIRFVGETTASKLSSYFKTIENLRNASLEELLQVPDVGEKVAQSIKAYFGEERYIQFVEKLQTAGLQFEAQNSNLEVLGDSLGGKSILYTGTFASFSREELENLIAAHGGNLVSSVSKKLDFLIVGDGAGPSKLKKAEDLGVIMIGEEEFKALIA